MCQRMAAWLPLSGVRGRARGPQAPRHVAGRPIRGSTPEALVTESLRDKVAFIAGGSSGQPTRSPLK